MIASKNPIFDTFDDHLIMIPIVLDTLVFHMAAKRLKVDVFQINLYLVAEREYRKFCQVKTFLNFFSFIHPENGILFKEK